MGSRLLSCLAIALFASVSACGGDDSGGDDGGAGGAAGAASGGTGGSSTGGTGATGGTSSGGTGGSATGGAAGSPAGGAAGAGSGFWPNAYDPSGSPDPVSGKHNPDKDCMAACHKAGGAADEWLFGGTVYQADKITPAPHVQIGVKSGANVYTAYSASNGNFWYPAGPTVDWSNVEIRARNAKGELKMTAAPGKPACNSCHTGTAVIVEP